MTIATCPACSGRGRLTGNDGVLECEMCMSVYTGDGVCLTLNDAEKVVSNEWSTDPEADGRARYYDLTFRDARGVVRRRHGWFDPRTRKVTQTG